MALAASGGAYAQGNGNGNGKGNGKGANAAAAETKGNNGGGKKADRGTQAMAKSANRGGGEARNDNRGNGNGNAARKMDRGPERKLVKAAQGNQANGNAIRYDDRRFDDRRDEPRRYDDRQERDTRWLAQDRDRALIDGCPPGLAKKNNGCNPPGQVKEQYQRSVYGYNYRPSLFGLTNYDRRGDYYYQDGYLVRYGDRGGISSWLPLLGGALGIGNVWPSNYQSYDVPDYYVDYYDLGGPDRYRYADNVIYRVNPDDAAITSIAALITGDDISVGQPMPSGYDVYNVPYAYRDRYYDTPDRQYRYSDGRIFQVDPQTRLVAAVIDLLV